MPAIYSDWHNNREVVVVNFKIRMRITNQGGLNRGVWANVPELLDFLVELSTFPILRYIIKTRLRSGTGWTRLGSGRRRQTNDEYERSLGWRVQRRLSLSSLSDCSSELMLISRSSRPARCNHYHRHGRKLELGNVTMVHDRCL